MKRQPLLKIPVFILLLFLAHGAISILFPVSLPAEIEQFDRYLEEGVDVLYYGDSTLVLPAGEVTTGEILQELLPDLRVGQVAHPAYGLDLFYDYTAYMDRRGVWPSTLVMPVNLRSFSPEWDRRPAYQFEKESRILALGLSWTRLLLRPLDVFGFFQPSISRQDFLDTPVYDGAVFVGRVRDFETLTGGEALQGDAGNVYREVSLDDAETAEAVLTYHYMFNLAPDHRKLDSMIKIVELAAERGVNVILYIGPVNVAQGEHFLGRTLSDRFVDHIQVVQSRLDAASLDNVTLLNLAFDLQTHNFIDMEHLTEIGKEHIAGQIALALQSEETLAAPATPMATPTATSVPTEATVVRPPTLAMADPPATPTATSSATPASTPTVTASATPAATPAATPTATPAATPTATPSATPTATPTVTPSAAPTATPAVTPADVLDVRYIERYTPSGPYPVDMYRITFETVDEFNQVVETQADLYLPYVEAEVTFPILGHAAGTTGIANECSPLNELATGRSWGSYHAHSLAYAAHGYIIVFPNWLHFDDPQRIHHYFVSDVQAQTMLDAIRAAYRFWDLDQELGTQARPAQTAFMMGYSSGGHAVFSAKDYAQAYAPELPIQGVIGFGPVTDPGLLLQEDPIFGPYLVYAYRDFYGEEIIDPAAVYLPNWVSEFEDDVLSLCVDEIFSYYSHSARRMYLPEFRQVLYDGRLADVYPQFAERLAENTAGLGGHTDIPVLIFQGTADTVITPPSQRRFVDQLCALGNSVTWVEYRAVSHAGTRWTAFDDALAWMDTIVQGNTPRSDCPPLD
jgi:pimeloyl-ACP methyl ester carboxylesterase